MIRFLNIGLRAVALACACFTTAFAGGAGAIAHLGSEGVWIGDEQGAVIIRVAMTQSVPWRVYTAESPPRLVVEFEELIFTKQPDQNSAGLLGVRVGKSAIGVSSLVAVLREPLKVANAEMMTSEDGAILTLRLLPTTADDFRAGAKTTDTEVLFSSIKNTYEQPLIAIDPGHGGFDPGAEVEDLRESVLMLQFALRLRDRLQSEGEFQVILTRESDVFVPLRDRHRKARLAGADVFISLHADSLVGEANQTTGLTVYTLGEGSTDEADRRLAQGHARGEIIAGADLSGTGDDVALTLLNLQRRDTAPRSKALSRLLIRSVEGAGLKINTRAERQADFAVLRSADIPSVLIELGFLSSHEERERLTSEAWQSEVVDAMAEALVQWTDDERRPDVPGK